MNRDEDVAVAKPLTDTGGDVTDDDLKAFIAKNHDPQGHDQVAGWLHEKAPEIARQNIELFNQGKLELDDEHLQLNTKLAQDGVGAWESLGRGVKYLWGHRNETLRDIGGFIAKGAVGAEKAGESLSEPERQLAADMEAGHPIDALWNYGLKAYKRAKNISAGAASGVATLGTGAIGLAAEATQLAAEPFLDPQKRQEWEASVNADVYQAERLKNRLSERLAKTAGADTEDPLYKFVEQAAPLAVPLGGSEVAATKLGRAGEKLYDAGTRAAGQTIAKTAQVAKVATPIGAAAELFASGHPYWAMAELGGAYGIGRLRRAIIEKPFDALINLGKRMATIPDGETFFGQARRTVEDEVARLRSQVADIKGKAGDKVADAFKLTEDGQPLYKADELVGDARRAREIQDRIGELQSRWKGLEPWEKLNRAYSAAAKTGIKLGLDSAVAGGVGAAFSGATEAPGQYEQARQGQAAGMAIGAAAQGARIPLNVRGQLREFNLGDLIRRGERSIGADHPDFQGHQGAMAALPQGARSYVNTYAGLAAGADNNVVVLRPEDFARKLGGKPEDAPVAPNGYYDPDAKTAYINADALTHGVVPHEVSHALAEAAGFLKEGHPIRTALDKLLSDQKFQAQIQGASDQYNQLVRQSDPNYTGLDHEGVMSEILADLSSDIVQQKTPEALYGGRSPAQQAGATLGRFLDRKSGNTSVFGWPVTPELRAAVSDALFDAGQKAAARIPGRVGAAERETAGGFTPEETQARQDAVDAINAINQNTTEKARKAVAAQIDSALERMKATGEEITAQKLIAATQQREVREVGPKAVEKAVEKAAEPPAAPTLPTEETPQGQPPAQAAKLSGQAPDPEAVLTREERAALHRAMEAGQVQGPEALAAWIERRTAGRRGELLQQVKAVQDSEQPFTVTFEKGDGSERTMRAQFGMKKDLKGGRKTTAGNPALYTVFDLDKGEYRTFDIDRVTKIEPERGKALMPREEPNESRFSEKLTSAAIRVNDIPFTGKTYEEARRKAREFGYTSKEVSAGEKGYVTNKGAFKTPDEASTFTAENRQMGKQAEAGPLRTQDFNRWRRYMPRGDDVTLPNGLTPEENRRYESIKAKPEPTSKEADDFSALTDKINANTEREGEFRRRNQGREDVTGEARRYMPSGFYSQLERTIASQPDKASPEQLRAAVLKGPGIKAVELRETKDKLGTSFEQWLKDNPEATKQQMLDFVRENQIQTKEITKQQSVYFTKELRGDEGTWQDRRPLSGDHKYAVVYRSGDTEKILDRFDNFADAKARERELNSADESEGGGTKYGDYQLPGGEHYGETLATLPEQKELRPQPFEYELRAIDPEEQPTLVRNGITHQVVFKDSGASVFSGTEAQAKARLEEKQKPWSAPRAPFKTSHWDEPNVVLHLRHNERDLPNGDKMWFMEEMQSDWAQKGRREGYQGSISPASLEMAEGEYSWSFTNPQSKQTVLVNKPGITLSRSIGNADSEASARQLATKFLNAESGVPDMPFKGSAWKQLGLKIALRKAIEAGADHLGWTTGEQQAERYDLSKRVEKITATKNKDGTFDVIVYPKGENAAGTISKGDLRPGQLPDFVGKDLADRIVNEAQPGGTDFMDLDLKVGGEGMKGFYDKELVNLANDLGKKWGVKVQDRRIKVTDMPQSEYDKYPEGHPYKERNNPLVHSLPITDAMRAEISEKGQRLFMPRGKGEPRDLQFMPLGREGELDLRGAALHRGVKVRPTGESGAVYPDLQRALDEWAGASGGGAKPSPRVTEELRHALPEIRYQLQAEGGKGMGWYKQDVDTALNEISPIVPEIKDPEQAKLFKVMTGNLSYGQDPLANLDDAVFAYRGYKDTGRIPLDRDGEPYGRYSGPVYSLRKLQGVIDKLGEQGAIDWLLSKHPISEIREMSPDISVTIRGKKTDEHYGAMIFGQKGGPFALNLNGINDHTTVDVWGVRALRRWRGELASHLTRRKNVEGIESDTPPTSAEIRDFHLITTKAAKRLGITPEDVQALLWYFEHKLYEVHGVGDKALSYSDVAPRVREKYEQSTVRARENARPGQVPEEEGQAAEPAGLPESAGAPF